MTKRKSKLKPTAYTRPPYNVRMPVCLTTNVPYEAGVAFKEICFERRKGVSAALREFVLAVVATARPAPVPPPPPEPTPPIEVEPDFVQMVQEVLDQKIKNKQPPTPAALIDDDLARQLRKIMEE